MSLPEQFYASLGTKSDRALFEMLQKQGDYLPEAIGAAREELVRRGVRTDVPPIPSANDLLRAEREKRAKEPLELPIGIIIMLTVFFSPVLSVVFMTLGYRRKVIDSWMWASYGLGFYLVLALVFHLGSKLLQ